RDKVDFEIGLSGEEREEVFQVREAAAGACVDRVDQNPDHARGSLFRRQYPVSLNLTSHCRATALPSSLPSTQSKRRRCSPGHAPFFVREQPYPRASPQQMRTSSSDFESRTMKPFTVPRGERHRWPKIGGNIRRLKTPDVHLLVPCDG